MGQRCCSSEYRGAREEGDERGEDDGHTRVWTEEDTYPIKSYAKGSSGYPSPAVMEAELAVPLTPKPSISSAQANEEQKERQVAPQQPKGPGLLERAATLVLQMEEEGGYVAEKEVQKTPGSTPPKEAKAAKSPPLPSAEATLLPAPPLPPPPGSPSSSGSPVQPRS